MATATPFLSVVINTKNSESTLEATLQSVQRWADEIVVMDMQSTDGTVALAKKYQATVYTHKDVGYVEPARNAAIAKARGNWILILDADETIPASLKELIEKKLIHDKRVDAYFLPRKNIIFGTWVHTGWWPDYVLRLFKTGAVQWSDEIHSIPQVTGTVERIEAKEEYAIIHENYQKIDQFIDRAQRYAAITVQSPKNTDSGETPWATFSDEVIRRYYEWKGIDDGLHGQYLSLLQGFAAVMQSALSWEKNGFPQKKQAQPVLLSQVFAQMSKDAKYWEAREQWQKSDGVVRLFWKARMIIKK